MLFEGNVGHERILDETGYFAREPAETAGSLWKEIRKLFALTKDC